MLPIAKVGIHTFYIPFEDARKGHRSFPLPKDNIVNEDHKNKAKMYCSSFTNEISCESAGWTLNKQVDNDIVCRWGIETDTASTAALIGGVGTQTKDIPIIGGFIDLFAKPVAKTVESAGKIETCHYIELPGSMTIDEFYRRSKESSTAQPPVQQVQPVQAQPPAQPPQSPPSQPVMDQPVPAEQLPGAVSQGVGSSMPVAAETGNAKRSRGWLHHH